MIISRDEIKDLQPVAEGYKIFNHNWTANYGNNYCYADENGNVEGVIHKQLGFPERCQNGLHFCENPIDCMRYHPFVQWNKFAKVRGYGHIARSNDDSKVATEILEIIKVLSWNEFLQEIKKVALNNYGISDGNGINGGNGISDGNGISCGFGISCGYGISDGYGIRYGYGICDGYGIYNSQGISSCYFIKNCKGLFNSVMCRSKSGSNYLFNKKVSKARIDEVISEINSKRNGWYPKFTNAFELYHANGEKWEQTPAPMITGVDNKTAYKDMPQKLIEYLKGLPEFDAEIFNEITGLEDKYESIG